MKTTLYSLVILLGINFLAFGQEDFPCETDQINSKIFQSNPQLKNVLIQNKAELEEFTQNFKAQSITDRNGEPYIIPVVFHIIHDNGPGNISDEQIFDAVRMVNLQLRHQHEDTADVVEAFKHLQADTEIEIRLAKKDPDGNCTDGINRIYSPLTNTGGHVIKDLVQWPPDQYMNIWVANFVGTSLAGHCLMPPVADTIPEWDGIAIQHTYVGSIGTSDHFRRTVLTHEIGHYLNLYHIWGGNNVPGFYYLPVAQAQNCEHDDGVDDTPNTIGWSSCPLNATSCGDLDMVQNYMDYSYCHTLFTQGQKERMHATLNSPMAGRNNLWTEENLIATGVKDDYRPLCDVKIATSKRTICVGEEVSFVDLSYHHVDERNWTFEGGSITTSTDSTVSVSYSQLGIYSVTLTVSTDGEELTHTYENYVQVLSNEAINDKIMEDFENPVKFTENWFEELNPNHLNFERTNVGKDSDYAIFADNFNGPEKAKYTLISRVIDASEITKLVMTFDFAYAKSSTALNERLTIELSNDCGETWMQRGHLFLNSNYSILSDEEFIPTQEDWIYNEIEMNLAGIFNVEDLMIRLYFDANQGNNLYLDNINISDINQLDIASETLQNQLTIFPNPAKEHLTISLKDNILNGKIQLIDLSGKVIFEKTVNQESVSISTENIAPGTYFLHYTSKDGTLFYKGRKVVVL